MAYARFGDDCDVYVLLDVVGSLRCVDCQGPAPHEFADTASLIDHLRAHVDVGDRLPEALVGKLLEDAGENDLWIEDRSAGRVGPDDD